MVLNGIVDNVCLWDGDTASWQPPPEYTMVPIPEGSQASIGWGWDGTDFIPPESTTTQDPALLAQPGSAPDVVV